MPKKKTKKLIKNKKGFTLIEILAAITILGILTGIAVVSVTKVIENGKKEHYNAAEENMSLAGQSYVQQNRSALPKAIGQKQKVYLKTLVDKKYIQPVKDYSDNECDLEKSYVQIYKYSQSDYSYVTYLKCPGYTSEETLNNITPSITARINVDDAKSTVTGVVTINGNDKLMSYSYIVYRGDKEVKNTGNVSVKGYKESISLNIPLSEYSPGKIKLVITATNTYGQTKSKTVSQEVRDNKNPVCIIKDEDKESATKAWTNQDRKITVGCDDGDGSGCVRDEYSKTFKTTTGIGEITIQDEAGNTVKCKVKVNVDKTPPTCTNSGDSKTWIGTNRTINYGCNDPHSGCDPNYSGGSRVFSTTTKEATIAAYTIKDKVGNTTNCGTRDADVYVDKTPPTCSVTGGNASWTNGTRTIKASCSDSHSGCDTADFQKVYSSQIDTTTAGAVNNNSGGQVKDKVGNTTDCSANQTVKIDKTAPVCNVSGGNTVWTNGDVTVTGTCVDTGGSGCSAATVSQKITTTTNTTKSPGTVTDNAGNSTSCGSVQVKVDKDPPTCTSSGGNASWTNGNRTLTGTCSDTGGSGCSSTTITKVFDTNTNSTTASPGTVTDVAGNSKVCPANQTVKIDKTAPTVTSITNPSGGNATAPGLVLTYYGTDTGGSGIAKWRYTYNTANGWNDYASSGYSPFTSTPYTALRNQPVYVSVCDNAGNCSGASSTHIHIVDACSSTTTTWSGSWSTCSATCGGGTQTMSGTKYSTYNNANCGADSKSQACNTHTCGPPAHTHATGALGTTLKDCNWTLSCGTYHPKAYWAYCGVCWNYGVIYRSTTSKYCPGRNMDGCKNWGTVYPTVVPD